MVLPEGTPPEVTPRPGGRSALVAIAVAAFGAGVLGVSALTSPEGQTPLEYAATSTTIDVDQPLDLKDFTIDQIATGTPLAWESRLSVADGQPLGFARRGDWTYAFASVTTGSNGQNGGGLHVWRSLDTVTWDDLDEVIDRSHLITRVTATDDVLVAFEADQAVGAMTMWTSIDGVDWDRSSLSIEGNIPFDMVHVYGAAATDTSFVIVGDVGSNPLGSLEDLLDETYGGGIDASLYDWSKEGTDQDMVFRLWGPLGFPLVEVTGAELGLTEAERQSQIDSGDAGGSAEVWAAVNGERWKETSIEGASWIDSIVALPTGELLAAGGGRFSTTIWVSRDGVVWDELPLGSYPGRIEPWHGGLVGLSGTGRLLLSESADGREWRTLGSPGLPPLFDWQVNDFATGDAGIATAVTGRPLTVRDEARPDPAVVVSGDAVLTMDLRSGTYRVDVGDSTQTWSMSSGRSPDGVDVDMESSVISFSDPATGVHLADFSIGDVWNARQEYWSSQRIETEHRALLFSSDGANWSIQPIVDHTLTDLIVTGERVAGIAVGDGASTEPDASTGFEIWSAPTP